ncbi:MAG: RNA polymerase sigma factor [Planctomycetota bacterium]
MAPSWSLPAAGSWPEPKPGSLSERELVERARRDPRAFDELYRATYPSVAGHVFRRTGDAAATEEIVSDVYLLALTRLSTFRWKGISFRFWLLRIATRAAGRWVRTRRRREGLVEPSADPAAAAAPAAPAAAEDETERALRALQTLPAPYQDALSLHYLEGLAVRDVAAVLGCREGTVKSRLARGREELRRRLAEDDPR